MYDNIQFHTPIDSSQGYKSLHDWVLDGLSAFVPMMQLSEPVELQGSDTRTAQIKALREVGKLLKDDAKATIDFLATPQDSTLGAWYQYAIMEFLRDTYKNVPSRFFPDTVETEAQKNEYVIETTYSAIEAYRKTLVI